MDLAGSAESARPGTGCAASRLVEFAVPARIREWARSEVGAGRLLPWFAVAFGLGIVVYFTAEREPAWWAASPLAVACASLRRAAAPACRGLRGGARRFRRRRGLCRCDAQDGADRPSGAAVFDVGRVVAGFVELREESQHTDRFVLRVDADRRRPHRRQAATCAAFGDAAAWRRPPAPSSRSKAQLDPPLQPLRPGSYDFARDLYFQGIGASGFVHGAIKVITPPRRGRARGMRADAVHPRAARCDRRRASARCLPGDAGAIASALITGKRDAIDAASLRRDVRVRHRPRAVDLRLSHGGRRRRRVLHLPRAAGADPRASRPDADQEMGRVRGSSRDGILSGSFRRRSSDAAVVHHDRHRAGRRACSIGRC